jgi:hypothetical protein
MCAFQLVAQHARPCSHTHSACCVLQAAAPDSPSLARILRHACAARRQTTTLFAEGIYGLCVAEVPTGMSGWILPSNGTNANGRRLSEAASAYVPAAVLQDADFAWLADVTCTVFRAPVRTHTPARTPTSARAPLSQTPRRFQNPRPVSPHHTPHDPFESMRVARRFAQSPPPLPPLPETTSAEALTNEFTNNNNVRASIIVALSAGGLCCVVLVILMLMRPRRAEAKVEPPPPSDFVPDEVPDHTAHTSVHACLLALHGVHSSH